MSPCEFHLTLDVQLQSTHDGLQDAGLEAPSAVAIDNTAKAGTETGRYNLGIGVGTRPTAGTSPAPTPGIIYR